MTEARPILPHSVHSTTAVSALRVSRQSAPYRALHHTQRTALLLVSLGRPFRFQHLISCITSRYITCFFLFWCGVQHVPQHPRISYTEKQEKEEDLEKEGRKEVTNDKLTSITNCGNLKYLRYFVIQFHRSVYVAVCYYRPHFIYRVIQNDCRGFNNLSYTIHLR